MPVGWGVCVCLCAWCKPLIPAACPADSSLLQDNVAFVLCLDTLGRGDRLHLHVSRPPREGTLQHAFLRELEMVGVLLGGSSFQVLLGVGHP